jgi:hypothetical protein
MDARDSAKMPESIDGGNWETAAIATFLPGLFHNSETPSILLALLIGKQLPK